MIKITDYEFGDKDGLIYSVDDIKSVVIDYGDGMLHLYINGKEVAYLEMSNDFTIDIDMTIGEAKRYMFQYAMRNGVVMEDTGLITKQEAVALFDKYKDHFKEQLGKGNDPEMCIWENCKDRFDYHTRMEGYSWSHDKMEVQNGELCHIHTSKWKAM